MTSKASGHPHIITLRTVLVLLKNGNHRIKVNALLDNASTTNYMNTDIAVELDLQVNFQKVTVNVMNGQVDTFGTMPMEVGKF